MKKSHLLGAVRTCVLIAGFLLTTTANAMLVNIDFGPNGSAPYNGQGILGGATYTNWNPVGSNGAFDLFFDDLTTGTIDVAVSYDVGLAATGTSTLLGDYIHTTSEVQQTITFSDLTPNAFFDIVLYNGRFSQDYSIAGQTGNASTNPVYTAQPGDTTNDSRNTDYPNWVEGVEYAWLRSAMSDSKGQLQILVDRIFVSGNTTAAIAGLQIQEITTVPVPAAVWLFGSGLLGLLGIARRKQAT